MKAGTAKQKIDLVRRLILDVILTPGKIQISLLQMVLRTELLGETHPQCEDKTIVLEERFTIARRGGEARLILSDGKGSGKVPVPSLIGAIVQARTWAEWIISGKVVTLGELARKAGRSRQYTTRILRLTALCPDLVDCLFVGLHPPSLTVPQLTAKFPLSWMEQTFARRVPSPLVSH